MKYGNQSRPNGTYTRTRYPDVDQHRLQIAANAVQHLELEPIRRDAVFRRPLPGEFDHRRIVRGDRGIVAVGDQHLHHPRVRRVDIRLLRIRHRLRFAVRALDQADARAERVDAPQIAFAATQIRLQHDADLPVALLPERLEDLERDVGVARALHVDPHEKTGRLGELENLAQVVDRARAIDVEAELRQLQRDVALDARLDDGPDDVEIVAGGGDGLGRAW